jgi:hypothetical protein
LEHNLQLSLLKHDPCVLAVVVLASLCQKCTNWKWAEMKHKWKFCNTNVKLTNTDHRFNNVEFVNMNIHHNQRVRMPCMVGLHLLEHIIPYICSLKLSNSLNKMTYGLKRHILEGNQFNSIRLGHEDNGNEFFWHLSTLL